MKPTRYCKDQAAGRHGTLWAMITVAFPALHPLFESLGYAGGFAVYRGMRSGQGDQLTNERRWAVIAAAVLGALVGSRILALLEVAPQIGWSWGTIVQPGGGKTIVGGLLGGWVGVELVKKLARIHSRTGDLFAIPLCVGIAIGRIGCFLAGVADDTYGTPTSLPWGVDFGDGVRRHPTQLYEICFLAGLALLLFRTSRRPRRQGTIFRIFMGAYLSWRLAVDFIKPQPLVHGLNMIQWTCIAGIFAVILGQLPIGAEATNA